MKTLKPSKIVTLILIFLIFLFPFIHAQTTNLSQIENLPPSLIKKLNQLSPEEREEAIKNLQKRIKPSINLPQPSINILNFQIESVSNSKIKGFFEILNPSQIPITDLTYYLTLSELPELKEKTPNEAELIIKPYVSKFQHNTPLTLNPKEKKKITFTFSYPQTIHSGEYQLELILQRQTGRFVYTMDSIILNLTGKGTMLKIDSTNCKIIGEDGKEYPSFQAPPFEPGKKPKVKCEIKNPNDFSIDFKIQYETGRLHVLSYQNQIPEVSEGKDTFHLPPDTAINITFELPSKTQPGVYESFVRFLDTNSNEVISPYLILRWTIKGEAARIDNLWVYPFKSFYTKNEEITLSYTYSPSPDLYWRDFLPGTGTEIENPKIIFTFYDKDNTICLQSTKNMENAYRNEQINLSFSQDCQVSKLLVKVIDSENNTLTTYSLKFPAPITPSLNIYLIAGTIIAALIIIIILSKKHIKKTLSVFVILLILFTLFPLTEASSGSFNYRVANAGNYNTKRAPVKLHAKITSYQISDYPEGSYPSTAYAKISYYTTGGLCDNDDVVVWFTAYINDDFSNKYKIKIDNKGIRQHESGTFTFNFLNSNTLKNKFKSLSQGSHTLVVDGRLTFCHPGNGCYPGKDSYHLEWGTEHLACGAYNKDDAYNYWPHLSASCAQEVNECIENYQLYTESPGVICDPDFCFIWEEIAEEFEAFVPDPIIILCGLFEDPDSTPCKVRRCIVNAGCNADNLKYCEDEGASWSSLPLVFPLSFTVQRPYVDCGLRAYDGHNIIKFACEPPGKVTSPLRIAKNGKIYGIVLVNPSDSMASPVRIKTSNGIKALRKL